MCADTGCRVHSAQRVSAADRAEHAPAAVRYHLQAIVSHLGYTMDSGHYVADVRSPLDGKWREFDDSLVTEVCTNR